MKTEHKTKKHVAWYWLSLMCFVLSLLAYGLGGVVGALFSVFVLIFFIISLIEAVRGGVHSKYGEQIPIGNRIAAFFLAFMIGMTLASFARLLVGAA